MNFGQNLYNWFSFKRSITGAFSNRCDWLVILASKSEFSKLIGFLIIAIIAVGLVFNAARVKDILLELLIALLVLK